VTRSRRWREQQLEGIERFVAECEKDIFEALQADLGKPEIEAFGTEISYVANDARHA
ncbi:MAG: aldehyde dehydrogenase family protein, partial [Gammaproteobacteria bacterium]|nr:aldehyde dehydrogenase family protein [Gammaproteobacteria bacterium]